MKTVINPPEMAAPTGYSYAIKKTGMPVFISGQVALDGKGTLVGENDVAAQVEQVFANLRSVVGACGGTLDDVVKITIYVTDINQRQGVHKARQEYFSGDFPTATTVQVVALADPAYRVEIDVIAHIGAGGR